MLRGGGSGLKYCVIRNRLLACCFIASLGAAPWSAPSWAQQAAPTPTEPGQDLLRRQREIEDAGRAGRSVTTPARRVEYQEVLERPNDVALNFGWAQTQVERGDIKGAANTLERILLIAPNQAPIRLLYAIVLYRLERLQEAERELDQLQGLPMAASLQAEIGRYRRDIAFARKQTKFTATLSLGMQYDWNRNSSPRSGEAQFLDLRFPVAAADRRGSDWQIQSIGRIEMSHALEGQDNDRITAGATYLRGDQARRSDYDLQLGSVEFGGVIDFAPTWLVPNFFARHIALANQRYGRVEGASLRVEQRFSGRFQIYGFGEGENQTYTRISRSTRAPQRSGFQSTLGAGAIWVAAPAHRLSLEAAGVWKNARERHESYSGPTATFTHTWLLGQGMFLVTSLSGEANAYDEPDRLVSSRTRRDTIGRARTTFGVPVALFIENERISQSEALRDLTFFVSVEGQRALSNIVGNSYDNYRFALGFTKRWDF
jgi:tetratricopeptide (TPR) repeat protein